MEKHLVALKELVIQGEITEIEAAVAAALKDGVLPADILNLGLIMAMDEVGAKFERGEYFVPEMLVSARTMQKGLEVIKPLLVETGVKATGTVVIGTVSGDLHDIGKNLVAMMLEGAGFEVHDLGVDVSPDIFVQEARSKSADIIGLSALLTTTLPSMEKTIEAVTRAGLDGSVKIIVGGAPVNPDYAGKIGADGYAQDAGKAVVLAKKLVSDSNNRQPV